jgi:hypothetical protein
MKFKIYWTDLTFEKQEEIEGEVRADVEADFADEAKANRIKFPTDYASKTDEEILQDLYSYEYGLEGFVDEKVDEIINNEFFAEGEI